MDGFTPTIMDNSKDREVIKVIKDQLRNCDEAKFAIGYFFINGFSLVEDDFPDTFEKKPFLKIVMGDETTERTGQEISEGYELREFFKQRLLEDLQDGGLSETQIENISTLKRLIADNVIEVKLFDKRKLHAKLYLFVSNGGEFSSPGVAMVGSSNFTKKGLTENKELNVVLSSREAVEYLNKWFDDLWDEAIDFSEDMIKIIDYSNVLPGTEYPQIGKYLDPDTLFKYLVYHWFDGRVKNMLKKDILMEFQLIGVMNAIKSIDTYNGVILADSVGLGKSFIAGAIIEEFIYGKHPDWVFNGKKPSALLILPPSLIPQWEELLLKQEYFFQGNKKVMLNNNSKLNLEYEIHDSNGLLGKIGFLSLGIFQNMKKYSLKRLAGEYDVFIVDEAHKYRNSNTNRWRNLRKLQKKTDGLHDNKFLLLTATPINNSIKDVYNLMRLFIDDTFMPFKVKGINVSELMNEYFKLKKDLGNENLPELKKELKKVAIKIKKDILDEIMVLRTRKYILKQFKDLEINGKPLVFKDPQPYSLEYSEISKESYSEFLEFLKEKILELRFEHTKLYGTQYIVFEEEAIGKEEPEKKIVELAELLRLLLGKRLESGIYPFETTLRRIYKKGKIFYETFKAHEISDEETFKKILKKAMKKARIEKDLDEILDEYDLEPTRIERIIDLIKYHTNTDNISKAIQRMLEIIKKDLRIMDEILNNIDSLKDKKHKSIITLGKIPKEDKDIIELPIYVYKDDPKLRALKEIIGNPNYRSGKIDAPSLNGRKIVIFTQYKDTAYYLYHNLQYWVKNERDLHTWLKDDDRLKIGLVTGETETSTKINFIKRFAPSANNGWREVEKFGEIEILITTDALSEGVNLQDADAVINYDLPWNPMIIIQRVGRVNRIGNEKDINVINYMPSKEIEILVGILDKLQEKIDDITLVVGKDVRILSPDEKINIETFGEKIKDLSQISIKKLEEYGLSDEIKEFIPEKIPEKQMDEYKLLNIIQYNLGYTPEDFKKVEDMKGPYYTYIEGDNRLFSIYEYYKGQYKINKQVLTIDNEGKVQEVSPLVLLELVKSQAEKPYNIEAAVQKLKKLEEKVSEEKENLKEIQETQRGFLKKLHDKLLTRRDETKDIQKFKSVLITLRSLPYYVYSREIKNLLSENDLMKSYGNDIEIKDVNNIVDLLSEYFDEKGVSEIGSLKVETKHLGWYYEY